MSKPTHEAQREFDRLYMTSTEILKRLGIARSTLLLARRAGRLPQAIELTGQTFIWVRKDAEPYVAAWELMRSVKAAAQ